jgi:hypothetical protein
MRWKVSVPGNRRRRRGFLLLPKRIGSKVRWLERATWSEVYYRGSRLVRWVPYAWVDEKEQG